MKVNHQKTTFKKYVPVTARAATSMQDASHKTTKRPTRSQNKPNQYAAIQSHLFDLPY